MPLARAAVPGYIAILVLGCALIPQLEGHRQSARLSGISWKYDTRGRGLDLYCRQRKKQLR